MCARCGTLLERWCSQDPDTGNVVNLPVLVPIHMFKGTASESDLVTREVEVDKGRYSSTERVSMVQIDYFCPGCNADVLSSRTEPWKGELPASAHY